MDAVRLAKSRHLVHPVGEVFVPGHRHSLVWGQVNGGKAERIGGRRAYLINLPGFGLRASGLAAGLGAACHLKPTA